MSRSPGWDGVVAHMSAGAGNSSLHPEAAQLIEAASRRSRARAWETGDKSYIEIDTCIVF